MSQFHLTVAAVIEHAGRFLLVTDNTRHGPKLNQPAGHVETNEDLITAVIREVKEETSLDFTPHAVCGLYVYHPNPTTTYLRVAFKGSIADYSQPPQPQPTDPDVLSAAWYPLTEIQAKPEQHRSMLVLQTLEDYLAGQEYPLAMVQSYRERLPLNLK
jgi:8-oxo-dGTP pyrophosphatase MutT (NUDIX family)